MFGLLVFGMICVVATVFFWWYELKYYLDHMYHPKQSKNAVKAWFQRFGAGLFNIYRLFTDGKFFFFDLTATLFLTSVMGMGEGVTGGILGLFLSDAISILLIIVMKKQKTLRMQAQGVAI